MKIHRRIRYSDYEPDVYDNTYDRVKISRKYHYNLDDHNRYVAVNYIGWIDRLDNDSFKFDHIAKSVYKTNVLSYQDWKVIRLD